MTDDNSSPAKRGELASVTRRVLVADDEQSLTRALKRALSAAGFDVMVVHDGNGALDAVVRSRFDVILTDIKMPGISGIELLSMVRAYDLDVPIVLMTGNPEIRDALVALELGALQYLAKPFSLETVVSVVDRASRLPRLASVNREALELSGRA